MKIVFLSHSPSNPDGGASRIYHLLTDGLRGRGHDVDALHLEDLNPPRSPRARLVVHRFAMPWLLSRQGRRLDLAGTDVVMSSSGMAAPLFRHLRRGSGRRPLLVNHIHGLSAADHIANLTEHAYGHQDLSVRYRLVTGPLPVRWDAAGIREADVTVVQNLRDLGEAKRMRPNGEVVLIPPAVHPDLLAAGERLAPLDERPAAAVLWFGTWEARKGAAYVPGAFHKLRTYFPDATLVVGGTGRSRASVIGDFHPADRQSVTVLGRVSRAEQAVLMQECSVMLFPSLSEGFGLALLEAMSFGLAAVTTSTAFGGDHLTSDVNAKVVPPTVEHVGRALVQLVGNPAERCALAERGRVLARGFTLDRMLDAYEALFLQRAHEWAPR